MEQIYGHTGINSSLCQNLSLWKTCHLLTVTVIFIFTVIDSSLCQNLSLWKTRHLLAVTVIFIIIIRLSPWDWKWCQVRPNIYICKVSISQLNSHFPAIKGKTVHALGLQSVAEVDGSKADDDVYYSGTHPCWLPLISSVLQLDLVGCCLSSWPVRGNMNRSIKSDWSLLCYQLRTDNLAVNWVLLLIWLLLT